MKLYKIPAEVRARRSKDLDNFFPKGYSLLCQKAITPIYFMFMRTEGKKIAWSGIAWFVISAQFRRWSRKRAAGGNQTKKQKRFSWVYF